MRIAASAAVAAVLLCLAPVDRADAADGDQRFASLGDCELEGGGAIRECRIGYRTWGKLNEDKSNAILMPTWFNGRSEDLAFMVGPQFLDPERYFILAIDALANGVSSSPSTSRLQAGEAFPAISVGDMVDVQYRLVTEVFGVRKLHAVVGLSMGAMQALEWSVRMPDFAARMVAVIGSPRLTAFDLTTWETYGRILALYRMCQCDAAAEALAGLSMVTSVPSRLNSELDRSAVAPEIVKRGRARRARFEDLAATWDTERQLRAMLAHDISRRFGLDMTAAAKSVTARSLIVVSADDLVVTPGPSLEFAQLIGAETVVLDADCGHADPWCAPEVFAKAVKDFLNDASTGAADTAEPMDRIARAYVGLVLELGEHDADFVDAYYGPAEWRAQAKQRNRGLAELEADARALASELAAVKPGKDAPLERRRVRFLSAQLEAVRTRIDMLQGEKLSFDEESRRLYGVVAPRHDERHYREALRAVDAATPGEGSLAERAEALRQRSIVPADRIDTVLRRGLQECRDRSLPHVPLPDGESFSVEYVRGEPWGAYNWYKGGLRSVIQVNLDPPFVVNRAVSLSCHEGYPGHHAYNAMLEHHLVRKRGWVEFTVYPLFSPQSLIAEGTADFGTELAFPDQSLWPWVGQHLVPMAGLDPGVSGVQGKLQAAERPLRSLRIDVAREYLDGRLSRQEALRWLAEFGRVSREEAERALRFIERYRSYVINYSYGEDLVRAYVDTVGGQDPGKRWSVFRGLLSTPTVPADLVVDPPAR